MATVWQEFYCNKCDRYIRVKINKALTMAVKFVCPNCDRHHPRYIENGILQDNYGRSGSFPSYVEVIRPLKSASSKESWVAQKNGRDGIPISKGDVPEKELEARSILMQSWAERFGVAQHPAYRKNGKGTGVIKRLKKRLTKKRSTKRSKA